MTVMTPKERRGLNHPVYLAFSLSMPGRASWNGQWSGEKKRYVRVCALQRPLADIALRRRTYSYRWSDGWAAAVDVREVDAKEAARLRETSDGFSGYEWMVDGILAEHTIDGRIFADHEWHDRGAQ